MKTSESQRKSIISHDLREGPQKRHRGATPGTGEEGGGTIIEIDHQIGQTRGFMKQKYQSSGGEIEGFPSIQNVLYSKQIG